MRETDRRLLEPLKIGKVEIAHPIIQGGMGVGISWDELAGNVSKNGCLGVISAVGTGYYQERKFAETFKERPKDAENFYSKEALGEIIKNARKICGDKPLGVNVLYAINDYGRVVRDACEAGADMIITGAGLPTNMPEFTADFPDVALVPIVSSPKALQIICKRWEMRYKRMPDAVIVEGPLSGGHQGFSYDDCFKEEFQLENLIKPVVDIAEKWGDIPIIAAGGIWNREDIIKFLDLGAKGVQMATRFLGTFECDAKAYHEVMLKATEDDIKLIKSPVGYPARAVTSPLLENVDAGSGPKVSCISNCVSPCKRGEEAKVVGYCIADRLADGYKGSLEEGLFFSGSNGYRIDKIISVEELIEKLIYGE